MIPSLSSTPENGIKTPLFFQNKHGKYKKFQNLPKEVKKHFEILFEHVAPKAILHITPTLVKIKDTFRDATYNNLLILNYTNHQFTIKSNCIYLNDEQAILGHYHYQFSHHSSYAVAYHVLKYSQAIIFESILHRRYKLDIFPKDRFILNLNGREDGKKAQRLHDRIPTIIPNAQEFIEKDYNMLILGIGTYGFDNPPLRLFHFKKRSTTSEVLLLNQTPLNITIDIANRLFINRELFLFLNKGDCYIRAYFEKKDEVCIFIHFYNGYHPLNRHYFKLFLDPVGGYLNKKKYSKNQKRRAFSPLWIAKYDEGSAFYKLKLPLDLFCIIIRNYLN